MKALYFKIFLLGLLAVVLLPANAQNVTYTTSGGLKMGFGLGSSYQASDIKNSRGGGFDIWLGTPIYQRENAFFALDWRFRLLAGYNQAYDHRVNIDGSYNNVQFTHFNYDLELALTLNRLRERTGIILSGFAGAGITHGITSADLLDAANNPYDYASILPNRDPSEILADLDQLTDQDFETRLLNRAAILPTAGIYLGYEFTPRFALGVEHKMNFSLSEDNSTFGIDIDNRAIAGSSLDFNNYTSIVFRWALGGRSSGKSSTLTQETIPAPAAVASAPQVDITTPNDNPYETTDSSVRVTARITNIKRKEEISVKLNEQNQDFEYYASIGLIEINTNLQMGSNSLEISCQNATGSDSDELVLFYRTPSVKNLPELQFINPPSGIEVEQNRYAVQIQSSNITTKDDVTLSVNSRGVYNFNYDSNGIITLDLDLKEGRNEIMVRGRNADGTVTERTNITYVRPEQELPPGEEVFQPVTSWPGNYGSTTGVVTETIHVEPVTETRTETIHDEPVTGTRKEVIYVEPDRDRDRVVIKEPCEPPSISMYISEVSAQNITHQLSARLQNVSSKSQVTLSVNGRPDNGFQFNPAMGEISRSFKLNPGTHTILVSVNNGCGRDSESKQVQVMEVPEIPEIPETTDPDAGWVKINPGNASWEFCLQTPRGNYNRDNLSNSNFSYSGSAGSLYIKPTAGGGTAIINGKAFNLNSGQYYHFVGNLKVQVTNRHQGAMGQWSVYIESGIAPLTGKGNKRPKSPCETGKKKSSR